MEKPPRLIFIMFLVFSSFPGHPVNILADSTMPADIGVVLDFGTPAGKKNWISISMAIEDFYASKPIHSTRVVLHARDSNQDIVGTASAEDKLVSNLSRLAIIVWVFVVLILTSSYTASLTSLLTVQQLKPTVSDVSDLLKNGDNVGYQDGSFVVNLLKQMKFDQNMLKNLSTTEDYSDALSKGSSENGVAAIFDEIPYLKLFLSEHCSDYTMVGQTYKTGGFGFVFPLGSPLVPDISRAVLNVTEGNTMTEIERKWFGDPSSCPTQTDSFSSTTLDFQNFGGLFLITGAVSSLALFIFIVDFIYRERRELRVVGDAAGSSFGKRLMTWAIYFDSKDTKSNNSSKKEEEGDVISDDVNVVTKNGIGSQSPYSNFSDANLAPPDDGVSITESGTPGMESPLPGDFIIEMGIEHQE